MEHGLTYENLLILAASFPQLLLACSRRLSWCGDFALHVGRIGLVCKFRGLRRGVV